MSATRPIRRWSAVLSLAIVALAAPGRAEAAPIAVFDFNTSPNSSKQYTNNGLTITLGGNYALDSTYDGDGHVVGSMVGNKFVPLTLGTSDGGVVRSLDSNGNIVYDKFIKNSGGTTFTLTFSERVFSVAYDYQIFPNNVNAPTPSNPTNPNQFPDLTINAYDGSTLVFTEKYLGAFPAAPGSVVSRLFNPEKYAQAIGTDSFMVPGGFTKLEVIDWPVTVAIDNFQVFALPPPPPPAVPEPASVLTWVLCACAFGASMVWVKRRRYAVA